MALNASATRTRSSKDVYLTRQQIEAMIADGWTIIIVDGHVLKLDAWLKYHPGGEKTIMHMVGRDATDEVNAYENQIKSPFWNANFVYVKGYTRPMLVHA